MLRRRVRALVLLLLLGVALGNAAQGQDKRAAREREAMRRSQQQVQQLRQEKGALEERLAALGRENADLAQDRKRLSEQVAGALSRARSESANGRQLAQALEEMTSQKQVVDREKRVVEAQKQVVERERQTLQNLKTDLERRLAELGVRQTATEAELARVLAEKKALDASLQARVQQVGSCEDKNVLLYGVGRDLIEQCRDRSRTAALLRLEPITGLGRVAIENLLEEYRDKLDAQRLPPRMP